MPKQTTPCRSWSSGHRVERSARGPAHSRAPRQVKSTGLCGGRRREATRREATIKAKSIAFEKVGQMPDAGRIEALVRPVSSSQNGNDDVRNSLYAFLVHASGGGQEQ
jgi:hypothetical protein